jgi:polyphosphate kinase
MSKKDKKDKKDKKAKKKHSSNGTENQEVIEVETISRNQQVTSLIPRYGQIPIDKKTYEKELARLQLELVKLQEWARANKLKVVVIFAGRDAAGKDGVIKGITENLNPPHLPRAGIGNPRRTRKDSMVFPALRGAASLRGRDSIVQPQLV